MMKKLVPSLSMLGVIVALVSCSAPLAPETLPPQMTVYYNNAAGTCLTQDDENSPWRPATDVSPVESVRYTTEHHLVRDETDSIGLGQFLAYKTDAKGKTQTISYNYKKTGADTAEIEHPGYEWSTTYTLKFDTPVSGTASYEYVEAGWGEKGTDIPFLIK